MTTESVGVSDRAGVIVKDSSGKVVRTVGVYDSQQAGAVTYEFSDGQYLARLNWNGLRFVAGGGTPVEAKENLDIKIAKVLREVLNTEDRLLTDEMIDLKRMLEKRYGDQRTR